MKVSLIIPVYNVENYIDKCLKSVEQQTCKELEVIIINVGSTDESYEIVRKYVERNKNFQCYSIENRGLGGARNYGLEFGENLAVLELFFRPKNFDITSSDLQNIGLVFTSLESIKEKFQLSK